MTIDAKPDVLTRRDLIPILTLEEITDDDLEAFVTQLPEDRIPQAIVRIGDFRKGLKALEEQLETRYATTALAKMVWTDPATTLRYAWMAGARRGGFPDVEGFFDELATAGFDRRAIAASISPTGIRITVLREEAKENLVRAKELERIIKTHRTFGTGPEHLKCLDRVEDD